MSDPHPARPSDKEDKRGLLQKIAEFLHPSPDTKDELIDSLVQAQDNDIINEESRRMLEGVIRMSDMTAGDVMVAAAKMDLLSIDAPAATLLNQIIDTGHSRFPVYEGERENILGILLAKDMLKLQRAPELNIKALLRPVVFVPESKKLNDLLKQFRDHRQHMAMVIDEFGRTAGLITIEDVLEQIVGDIEDEFDIEQDEGDIFSLADQTFRISGDTSPERVMEVLGVDVLGALGDDDVHEFDTIGGLIAHEMAHGARQHLNLMDLFSSIPAPKFCTTLKKFSKVSKLTATLVVRSHSLDQR